MMAKLVLALAGSLTMAFSAPAAAQEVLDVTDSAGFRHGQTGITFPPSLLSADRERVIAFARNGFDVSALYLDRLGGVMISLYVYRAGMADVSVNFDTVLRGITSREGFSPAETASTKGTGFNPPTHANADSLMVAFPVQSGGEYASGGVALIPHGEWIVKVRVSSNQSPAELAEYLGQLIAALDLPVPSEPAPDAKPVVTCTTPLRTEDARRIEAEFEAIVPYSLALNGIGKQIEDALAQGESITRREWCADADSTRQGVYRRVGTDDTYVLMLSDSGTMLQVGDGGEPWGNLSPRNGGEYAAIISDSSTSTLFALFDNLPAPDRLDTLLAGARPLVRSDRAGEVHLLVDAPDGASAD